MQASVCARICSCTTWLANFLARARIHSGSSCYMSSYVSEINSIHRHSRAYILGHRSLLIDGDRSATCFSAGTRIHAYVDFHLPRICFGTHQHLVESTFRIQAWNTPGRVALRCSKAPSFVLMLCKPLSQQRTLRKARTALPTALGALHFATLQLHVRIVCVVLLFFINIQKNFKMHRPCATRSTHLAV